jgi:hypothetical protein
VTSFCVHSNEFSSSILGNPLATKRMAAYQEGLSSPRRYSPERRIVTTAFHPTNLTLSCRISVAIFRDIAPCSLHVNQRFGGMYHIIFRVQNQLSYEIGRIRSSETSVHIRSTWCYIPEDNNILNIQLTSS